MMRQTWRAWSIGGRVAALALAIAGAAAPVGAATFVVNSTADEVDTAPGNGSCATAGGACTLRAAVQEANALAGTDTISIPAGTFQLTLGGIGEDAAATGDLDITQAVEIAGAGREATIIDGLGADRVFHVLGAFALSVRDLTIRNGDAVGGPGGAIFDVGPAVLTIQRVRFEDNHGDPGGAILHANGECTVADSVFQGNTTSGGGGCIYKAGSGVLTVTGSEFTANFGGSGPGGAILFSGGPDPVSVASSRFSSNSGGTGGALYVGSSGGLTVTGSQFDGNTSATGPGGAILYSGGGTVTVGDSTFTDGFSIGGGGGLYVNTSASLTLSGCTFTGNTTLSGPGGALLFSSGGTGGLTAENTTFRGNAAVTGPGGGFYASAPGALTLTNVTVADNSALAPGGGALASGQATCTIARSQFAGNTVTGGPGGGLYEATGGATSISDTTFAQNRASGGAGGGLYRSGGALTLQGSTFSENHATGAGALGGGAFNSGPAAAVINSTFSANLAGLQGGGFFAASAVTFTNTTFSGNGAPTGGAVFNPGVAVTLANTILARSLDGGNCGGAAFTSGSNNIDDDASCALAGTGDRSVDPQLGPLADNGGPTQTHALLAGSPAADGANPATCPALDQRGTARPADGNGDGTAVCDIGAYELVDECPADPAKFAAGVCGCGVPDVDANGNGAIDCLVNAELQARIARIKTLLGSLTGERTDAQRAIVTELKTLANGLVPYIKQFKASIVLADPHAKLPKLGKRARSVVVGTLRKRGPALDRGRTKANAALDSLAGAVAP